MSDANAGRKVLITGNGESMPYQVYTVEPDGEVRELDCRSCTVMVQRNRDGSTAAEAMVYFTNPELNLLARRSADGVRAG